MAVQERDSDAAVSEEVQVLEFELDDQRYCVEIADIAEIVDEKILTSVPDSPRHVVGLMNLRDQTTKIIDPKIVFGMERTETDHRIIVFDTESDGQTGWLVDAVDQVTTFDRSMVQPQEDADAINGVLSRDEDFLLWVDPTVINDG